MTKVPTNLTAREFAEVVVRGHKPHIRDGTPERRDSRAIVKMARNDLIRMYDTPMSADRIVLHVAEHVANFMLRLNAAQRRQFSTCLHAMLGLPHGMRETR